MSSAPVRRLLYAALILLLALHNDFWLWNDARIFAGFPVGLLYHIGYCAATAALMGLLVRHAWPRSELEP